MTPKEAKEYLMQYRASVRRAQAAMDHLEELRTMATRITPIYGGDGGGSHQSGDKLGDAVAKIIEAEDRVEEEIELLQATQREVCSVISEIDDAICRTMIYERYISGKTFEQISVDLGYCWRHTLRVHGRALQLVCDLIEKRCH
jgi:hypothetical protein